MALDRDLGAVGRGAGESRRNKGNEGWDLGFQFSSSLALTFGA